MCASELSRFKRQLADWHSELDDSMDEWFTIECELARAIAAKKAKSTEVSSSSKTHLCFLQVALKINTVISYSLAQNTPHHIKDPQKL